MADSTIQFSDLTTNKFILNALEDLNFTIPTEIQAKAIKPVGSGKDVVGIAQTGTGKTFAYLLPILQNLKFSQQDTARVLILVPTRELVVQVEEEAKKLAKYLNHRIIGVYGGVNINTQKEKFSEGADIIISTPGRLYDLAVSRAIKLKSINKVIIDEVDVLLDLGFRFQLVNIFDILPEKRQHIMFSATMTEDVENLIDTFFIDPTKISVAISGTPLENIEQTSYNVPNYNTKVNVLSHLLKDKEEFKKVIVFISIKRIADRLFETLDETFYGDCSIIHSNKTQNYRLRSIEEFESGDKRILVATDIMARGLDIDNVTHVINIDTPIYPENYIHRIGRTGRAEKRGKSILFSTPKEQEHKKQIEDLMNYEIPLLEIPEGVSISNELQPEEREVKREHHNPLKPTDERGEAFHEKKEKNRKTNLGGSYRREIAKKYKKPKTKGDKNYNKRNKNKKR